MIRAYIDESGHSSDTAFVTCAGLMAPEGRWLSFESEWKAILDRYKISTVHMRDFAHSRREFVGWTEDSRRGLLSELITTITLCDATVFGAVMPMLVWNGMTAGQRKGALDPYFCCMQECLLAI